MKITDEKIFKDGTKRVVYITFYGDSKNEMIPAARVSIRSNGTGSFTACIEFQENSGMLSSWRHSEERFTDLRHTCEFIKRKIATMNKWLNQDFQMPESDLWEWHEYVPDRIPKAHLKLNKTFENTYVRELSIVSHAHEILDLYREALTTCDEKHKKELWDKYRNQCVDLMLVLASEYDSDPERITARIQKFAEKGKLDDEKN